MRSPSCLGPMLGFFFLRGVACGGLEAGGGGIPYAEDDGYHSGAENLRSDLGFFWVTPLAADA